MAAAAAPRPPKAEAITDIAVPDGCILEGVAFYRVSVSNAAGGPAWSIQKRYVMCHVGAMVRKPFHTMFHNFPRYVSRQLLSI
jgi:hypothetical protein